MALHSFPNQQIVTRHSKFIISEKHTHRLTKHNYIWKSLPGMANNNQGWQTITSHNRTSPFQSSLRNLVALQLMNKEDISLIPS